MTPDTDTVLHDVATRPAIMVETVTTDRGKVYLSQTFLEACERLEISVIEAAPRTGSDKPHIERLFGSINTGYGDDSKFRRDLDRLLPQLTEAARSIRALSDLLARHPEALIKGRTNTGKE
jgi:transposase InsO family protein